MIFEKRSSRSFFFIDVKQEDIMINSKEMMQQICMDRSEAETILTALAQLSVLCQKFGRFRV